LIFFYFLFTTSINSNMSMNFLVVGLTPTGMINNIHPKNSK
jgi:hypothetical protein